MDLTESENNMAEDESIAANDSLQRQEGASTGSNDFEEDFACSVCLRLSVQPTTLTCGHTSCRACLARWYFNSKKKECPLCRQPYQGHPMINAHIRNMIAKLCPVQLGEREKELNDDEEDKAIVKKYDDELSRERATGRSQSDMASFCAGIIIAISAFVVAYLAWYWQSSDANLLVLKPVQYWKPQDVASWLSEIPWAKRYADMSTENGVDGSILLSLSEKDLQHYLNVTDSTHQKALAFAIELLRDEGLKMPANLWEYKAIYPGRCLFLVYGLKDFPRTTFLYLYLYFYEDMFLPFLRATTQSAEDRLLVTNQSFTGEDITTSQWTAFLIYAAIVPEWLIMIFTFQMFSQHSMTPYFVLSTAVLYQIMEYIGWISFFRNREFGRMGSHMKSYVKQLMSAFMFMVLWPIVPNLVCDIFFYGALYVSPLQASKAVYHKFLEFNQRH